MHDFFSCENSSFLVTHQPQQFSNSYQLTNTSTSTFNCERMTISLFKYHCALREKMELL